MNNVSFTGIKLRDTKFEHVRDLVFHLERTGFNSYGKQRCLVNNTFEDKQRFFNNLRSENEFGDRDFGTVFLPWSREVYIVAAPTYEQLMLPLIKQYDKGAKINLMF